MPKPVLFTIYKVSSAKPLISKWRIRIPARFSHDGRLKYRYFRTKAEAQEERKRLLHLLVGTARGMLVSKMGCLPHLSLVQERQVLEAFEALAQAEARGIDVSHLTLPKCVELALGHPSVAGGHLTVDELVEKYYNARLSHWSATHQANMRGYKMWIAKQFQGVRAAELTKDDLKDWFKKRFSSAVSYNAAVRVYSALFTWAVAQGELKLSPMQGVESRRTVRRDMVDVLSLDEIRVLFDMCVKWKDVENHPLARARDKLDVNYLLDCSDCVLAFAVQLFAGVRPAEFERLDWSDVLFEQGLIRVLPSVSKTGRLRLVPIADVLLGLLEAVPLSERVGKVAPKNWKRKRYIVVKAAKLEGRHDVLRHSFASYHLAMWRDIGLLREAMGHEHGSKMTFDHYLTAVLPSDAPKYWAWSF